MLKFAATHLPQNNNENEVSAFLIVKTFVKNIMTVRIWGNPRTISNLNCLFSMHNWKWVNLSKMAGFNISLSLNERQSSSDKKHNKSLRLVLFIPFREAVLQAEIKGGNFGVKLTHLCGFWLDVSFFSPVKKHRSRFWLARTNLRKKIYDIAFCWVFLSMYIICLPCFGAWYTLWQISFLDATYLSIQHLHQKCKKRQSHWKTPWQTLVFNPSATTISFN